MTEKKQLSKRLSAVASYVPKGSVLLDIGTDHAYLPIELLKQNKISYAYAGEISEGPYKNAKKNIRNFSYEDKIELWLGAGFEVIQCIEHPEAIDVVTICGMGGQLIAEIIQEGVNNQQIPKNASLILQPNNQESFLREKLFKLGYDIVAETVIEEQGFYYEIIHVHPSNSKIEYTTDEIFFGPNLLKEPSKYFYKKWQERLKHYQTIEKQLLQAKTSPIEKITEVQMIIRKIKEVLK